MKNLLIITLLILGFGGVVYSAPYYTFTKTIVPEGDSAFDVGTSTLAYRNLYVDRICLSADCQTAWPSGGSGSGTVSTSSNETSGNIPFWTTISGTPAKLGSSNGLKFSTTTTFSLVEIGTNGTNNQGVLRLYTLNGGNSVIQASTTFTGGGVITLPTSGTIPALDSPNYRSWQYLQEFTNATSTLHSIGTLWLTGITSAIPLTDSAGLVSEYTGTSCTNQFVRSLSALGAATCASINNDDWSGADLSVANGGTGASTLTGLLQGNGTSAITGITGTAGQMPYYNGTNTLLATSTLFISTASRVGIGDTDPISVLHVFGPNVAGTNFNMFTASNSALAANIGGGIGFGGIFTGTTVTSFSYIQGAKENATDGNFDGYMRFFTRTTASGFGERLRITSTGNVGVGTTTPASFIFPTAAPVFDVSSAAGAGLSGVAMHDRDTNQESVFGTNGANFVMAVAGHTTATNNNITFQTEESNGQYSPTERMRIGNSGNIGIGTTSPSTLLQIFSTGTSTLSIDSNSASQGGCLELKDRDGVGYSYITVNNGVVSVSTNSCK